MSEAEAAAGQRRGRPAQIPYLEVLRLERAEVAIYLTNGVRLQGVIAWFDDYAVQLAGGQLVYKHAISSVNRCESGGRPSGPARGR